MNLALLVLEFVRLLVTQSIRNGSSVFFLIFLHENRELLKNKSDGAEVLEKISWRVSVAKKVPSIVQKFLGF